MKTIKDYLDDLKSKTGSDYKSALMLEMDRSVIANIRKRNLISDETALKVAELLKIDPGEVLLAAALARSNGAVKTAWESVSKRAGIAASIALTVVILGGNPVYQSFVNNIHYAYSL